MSALSALRFMEQHGPGPHTVTLHHGQRFHGIITFDSDARRIHIRHMGRVVTAWTDDVESLTTFVHDGRPGGVSLLEQPSHRRAPAPTTTTTNCGRSAATSGAASAAR